VPRSCIFCHREALPGISRCSEHRTPAQRKKGTTWRPRPDLHNSVWTELSKRIRRERPICEVPGCANPSASLDHIIPEHLGGTDHIGNLQALCAWHHQRKSASEGGRARARKRRS